MSFNRVENDVVYLDILSMMLLQEKGELQKVYDKRVFEWINYIK